MANIIFNAPLIWLNGVFMIIACLSGVYSRMSFRYAVLLPASLKVANPTPQNSRRKVSLLSRACIVTESILLDESSFLVLDQLVYVARELLSTILWVLGVL
jgi:hypothetical protein